MESEKIGKIDIEYQSIAYSLDEGMTWKKYKENPVITNPGIRDFRDPKIIWSSQYQKWVLVIAADKEIQFFSSENLKKWEWLSSFSKGTKNYKGVWECPDFFSVISKWM